MVNLGFQIGVLRHRRRRLRRSENGQIVEMLIKQRHIRRPSRMESRFAKSSARSREYMASICATAAVQGLIVIFLVVSAFRSYTLLRDRFADTTWQVRLLIPCGALFFALIAFRSFIGSLRKGIEIYKARRSSRPTR
jgi:hypothetical protein